MPTFKTAAECLTQISSIQWATQGIQGNRAKINRLMNGDPPYTEEERRINRLNSNNNWLEGPRIVKNADYQLANAFFGPGDYFTIALDTYSAVPIWKRDEWSACLTSYINKALRDSDLLESTIEQAIAQVVLHGPGPSLWTKRTAPIPETCGVDDVLVPAGTLADMSNLDFFAVYDEWTWGQLYGMTHGDAVDNGWNMAYVNALLEALYKQPLQPLYQGNRWLFPEKIAEDFKENSNTFAAAALGRALVWKCYTRNQNSGKWNQKILLDYNNITPESLRTQFSIEKARPEFLFEKDDYADEWRHIIHWFIGNCSTVAPYRYYSIRSIGYQLYGPTFMQNMVRNRHADHVLQELLMLFRNVSDDDREKLEQIELHHLGILPDGVSIVNAAERHSADWNLVGNFLSGNRQLMAESSAAYLPDIATEGEKPAMTATESLIRNNASVTLTSSVQNKLYKQAKHFFREIVRRVCLKDERDPVTKEVLRRMKLDRIPRQVLDIDIMEVTPNRVLGGGNRAVELTVAQKLMEARGAFGPTADLPIRRKYMLALTNDPEFVRATLPEEPIVSSSSLAAQYAFGTLMEGVPVQQSGTLNEVDYIETLFQLVGACMKPLEAMQEQPAALPIAAERITGLVNVAHHIEQHVQVLAQDASARERVRGYQALVNQVMQQLKAYAQRVTEMEQAGSQGQMSDAQAKIIGMQQIAAAKAEIMGKTADVKLEHKDAAFIAEQKRKDAQTTFEIQRKSALTHADVAAKDLTTTADLIHGARRAHVDQAVDEANAMQDHAVSHVSHAQDLANTQQAHEAEMQRTQEAHSAELAHLKEKHRVELESARAKAKAKPASKAA